MRFGFVPSLFLALSTFSWQAHALPNPNPAPPKFGNVRIVNAHAKNVIADKFIIVLKKDADAKTFTKHMTSVKSLHSNSKLGKRKASSGISRECGHITGFHAYSGEFDKATLEKIGRMAEVDYIELDTVFTTQAVKTQQNAPWGLSRISHKTMPASLEDYAYDSTAGKGVDVYVIDTGINTAHKDFGGRATWGANFANDNLDKDGNGHGTHVAGTIAGTKFGVAKSARVIAVKALDSEGSGENSNVLAAVDWVANTAKSGKSVINMSLGGPFSQALNDAIEGLVAQGITVVAAAGNEGADAMTSSPGSSASVITVGASDNEDGMAYFSNYGSAVDVIAPGVDITSAWIGSTSATETISGTSMACPHIAGLSAYIIAQKGSMQPAAVLNEIKRLATKDVLTGIPRRTVNLLAFNGVANSESPETPETPEAPEVPDSGSDEGIGGGDGSGDDDEGDDSDDPDWQPWNDWASGSWKQ